MKRMSPLYCLLLCLYLIAGCSRVLAPKGMNIYFVGTEAYAKKVNELKISPEDARKHCIEFYHNKPYSECTSGIYEGHTFIVNDSYVFNRLIKHVSGIPLFGYYVNGNTGEVGYNGLRNTFVKRTGVNSFYLFEENPYPSLTPERLRILQELKSERENEQQE